MSIESVAAELRILRRRIDQQQANRHAWPTKEEELAADVDRYDRRLLKAAAMLQIQVDERAVRGGAHFLLGNLERRSIEERLAEAGLDVRAPDDDLQT